MKQPDNLNTNTPATGFTRKAFYLAVHIPLILLFGVMGFYIYSFGLKFLLVYILLALISIVFQSYCCAYQNCPYTGFKSFCPGIGGFLILSSYVAFCLKRLPKSKLWFNFSASIAGLSAVIFVLYPILFLIKLNRLSPWLYIIVSIIYLISFFSLVCPGCAIVKICPGGVLCRKFCRNSNQIEK